MKIQTNRSDMSFLNVLRILEQIIVEKGLVGQMIKMTELSKICRNYKARLPIRSYRAKDLIQDFRILGRYSDLVEIDDMVIGVYEDRDSETGRLQHLIDFNCLVTKEQQHLKALEQQAIEDQI